MKDCSERFGFLVTDVGRLVSKLFDQRARDELGLSRAQCKVLAHLSSNDGINQSALAEMLEVTPIALARLLDRMAESGWIERHPHPTDRRAHRLRLTAKAEAALDGAWRVGDAVSEAALASLSGSDREALIRLLKQVRLNLTDGVERDAGSPKA